jgi:hypothetical protein
MNLILVVTVFAVFVANEAISADPDARIAFDNRRKDVIFARELQKKRKVSE